MNDKKSREEFEVWMRDVAKTVVGSSDLYAARLERMYWDTWQASRAALVIQPPAKFEFADPDGPYHKGYRQGVRSMVDAIEAAGVRAKS
jgi:hypothetical protein